MNILKKNGSRQNGVCELEVHKMISRLGIDRSNRMSDKSKTVYYCLWNFLPFPSLSPPLSLSLFSAAFTSNKLLVVVSEMYGDEREALDIVPVITTALLEEHQLVTGIIVVVDPGTIPINSRGEKQRVHLRDSFLADEVDPIYVAYNL